MLKRMQMFALVRLGLMFLAVVGCSYLAAGCAGAQDDQAAVSAKADEQSVAAPDAKEPTVEEEIAELKSSVSAASIAGHNAFMLICCALVLFMTAPGLALFYGGLVRKKNVLSIMMQCLFLCGLMTTIWAIYGYSLAFGNGGSLNAYIGGSDYLFMNGVARTWNESTNAPDTPMYSADLPYFTHMLFQGMFFIITPALICGAFAERMKFSAMVIFSILWGTLVYIPLAHWVWGGGMLAYGGEGSILGGALDFAGGTVVHISSGVSALVAALMIKPRLGHRREPMPPHNITYCAIGAAMLWFGWFGFNAGSELASDELATSAFAATHFAAATGALGWCFIEWLVRGKPTVLGVSSGLVAGLVCITPAAGFVNPMPALIMGFAAGVVCYFACTKLKSSFGYDDALDAFGVHGVGGALGAVLTGVFATRACWDIGEGKVLGLLEGGSQLLPQVVATAISIVFAAVASVIILFVVNILVGLRVDETKERQGLDISEHGEEGYIFV